MPKGNQLVTICDMFLMIYVIEVRLKKFKIFNTSDNVRWFIKMFPFEVSSLILEKNRVSGLQRIEDLCVKLCQIRWQEIFPFKELFYESKATSC